MSHSRPPNIIVFFTDQQRHDITGAHGCPLGLTPQFDKLAATGTHVAHSFTCQPVCGPARACLQTGRYATQTGVWRNGLAPHRDLPTLAQPFNAAGYHTAYIGKWHLYPPNLSRGAVPPEGRGGYRTWLAANSLEMVSDSYDTRLWDENGRERRLPGYRADALTDAAIRFIDARARDTSAAQPFFLFLSYLEPHHQNHRDDYPAPLGWETSFAGSWLPPDLASLRGTAPQHWPGYCGMVRRLDDCLGRLLDALHSLRLRDNTIILFTSDHSCHFKTRNDEYKRSAHDASIRVPTALCGPGFDGGGCVNQLVSLVDLPPTLLDAAGIPVPSSMVGRSILPLVRDPRTSWPDDVFVQISESQTGRAVRTRRWKYSVRCPDLDDAGQPVSQAHATRYIDDCLYDLQADPWELTNLVGFDSHRDLVRHLRARLARRMAAVGEPPAEFLDAPARPGGQRRVAPEEISL